MTGLIHIDALTFNPLRDSPSPPNSSEESFAHEDSFGFFDDLDGDLNGHDDLQGGLDGDAAPKRKSRRPPSTAERRATHNAVERARRETLNGRFLDLAQALPSMTNVKRPSKSTIVNKSLEYVQSTQAREVAILAENESLRVEVNELRARLGMPAIAPTTSLTANNAAAKRGRQASIVSTASLSTNGSPLIGGSPASLTSSTYEQVCPASAISMPQALPVLPNIAEVPVSTPSSADLGIPTGVPSFSPTVPGFPMMDMNYLMALSMQQQNYNMMNMANGRSAFAGFPQNWPNVNMGLPTSSGPDLTNNWLFA